MLADERISPSRQDSLGIMEVTLARLFVLMTLLVSATDSRVINTSNTAEQERENDVESPNNDWKAEVLGTLNSLKNALKTFEDEWEELPIDVDNSTSAIKKDNTTGSDASLNVTTLTYTQAEGNVTQSIKSDRNMITEDKSRRIQGNKVYGCPQAWPYHDSYPVTEPVCNADIECAPEELCCPLFHNSYCIKALDATPRLGECRFTSFNFLASMHCLIDDTGCKYDSECSEPTWKCCEGPCSYKECLPSTISPMPADIQKQQELLPSSQNPEFPSQHPSEQPMQTTGLLVHIDSITATNTETQDVPSGSIPAESDIAVVTTLTPFAKEELDTTPQMTELTATQQDIQSNGSQNMTTVSGLTEKFEVANGLSYRQATESHNIESMGQETVAFLANTTYRDDPHSWTEDSSEHDITETPSKEHNDAQNLYQTSQTIETERSNQQSHSNNTQQDPSLRYSRDGRNNVTAKTGTSGSRSAVTPLPLQPEAITTQSSAGRPMDSSLSNSLDNTSAAENSTPTSNTNFQEEFLPFFDFRFGEMDNVNFNEPVF